MPDKKKRPEKYAMLSVFFDFDGTLIDSRKRQYQLFGELLPACEFSFDEYWKIKRQRVSQAKMLKLYGKFDDEQIQSFHARWLEKIEDPERLMNDQPFSENMTDVLRKLSRKYALYLVTARQNPFMVHEQLRRFGWDDVFENILVTEQRHSKSDLIRQNVKTGEMDIIIGDTGEDIQAGKKLGIRTLAVTYGVMSKEVLMEYKPDYFVETPEGLVQYLEDLCSQ